MKRLFVAMSIIACLAMGGIIFAQVVKVDAGLSSYSPASGVSGNINSIGSDTLNNLMTLWAEGFKAAYPNVKIGIEGKGSILVIETHDEADGHKIVVHSINEPV